MSERDAKLDATARDQAVDQLIGLVGAVDGICQVQAKADAGYFVANAGRGFDACAASIIEPSSSTKRGSRTPLVTYCQR